MIKRKNASAIWLIVHDFKKTIGAFGRILLEYFLQGEMTWEVFSVETLQFGITVPVCL